MLIFLLTRNISQQYIPIFLEICKPLRAMTYYRNNIIPRGMLARGKAAYSYKLIDARSTIFQLSIV